MGALRPTEKKSTCEKQTDEAAIEIYERTDAVQKGTKECLLELTERRAGKKGLWDEGGGGAGTRLNGKRGGTVVSCGWAVINGCRRW